MSKKTCYLKFGQLYYNKANLLIESLLIENKRSYKIPCFRLIALLAETNLYAFIGPKKTRRQATNL